MKRAYFYIDDVIWLFRDLTRQRPASLFDNFMLKQLKKSPLNIVILCVTATLMVLFSVFCVSFSAVFYILISGGLGLVIFLSKYIKERKGTKK